MRKWLVFILLLGLTVFPSHANAQVVTKLDSVSIGLWSEYDQPSVLVLDEFVVAKNTPLPAKVTIRFPKEGNLIAVAVSNNGDLVNTSFDGPTDQGDWQAITLNIQSYNPYHIEYYQPFTRDGNKRIFKYQWAVDYFISKFSINILIPADSKNLVTTPPLSSTGISADSVHLVGAASREDLSAGQLYQFDMEYTRTSDAVTSSSQSTSIQPSEPIGSNTQGRVPVDKLPWLIGGMGVILIAVAVFAYWRSTSGGNRSPARARTRRNAPQEEPEDNAEVYCHECGTRAHTSDRFCRTCGSRLRVE